MDPFEKQFNAILNLNDSHAENSEQLKNAIESLKYDPEKNSVGKNTFLTHRSERKPLISCKDCGDYIAECVGQQKMEKISVPRLDYEQWRVMLNQRKSLVRHHFRMSIQRVILQKSGHKKIQFDPYNNFFVTVNSAQISKVTEKLRSMQAGRKLRLDEAWKGIKHAANSDPYQNLLNSIKKYSGGESAQIKPELKSKTISAKAITHDFRKDPYRGLLEKFDQLIAENKHKLEVQPHAKRMLPSEDVDRLVDVQSSTMKSRNKDPFSMMIGGFSKKVIRKSPEMELRSDGSEHLFAPAARLETPLRSIGEPSSSEYSVQSDADSARVSIPSDSGAGSFSSIEDQSTTDNLDLTIEDTTRLQSEAPNLSTTPKPDATQPKLKKPVYHRRKSPQPKGDVKLNEKTGISKVRQRRIKVEMPQQTEDDEIETIEIVHTRTRAVGASELSDIVERLCQPLDKRVHSKVVRELLRQERAHYFPRLERPKSRKDVEQIVDRLLARPQTRHEQQEDKHKRKNVGGYNNRRASASLSPKRRIERNKQALPHIYKVSRSSSNYRI